MFVFRKIVSEKSFSKLSYVCLPLEKVVKGKHFPVNGKYFTVKEKHFPVNGKHFPVKGKFDLVSRKVFSLLAVFVFRKVVSRKPLSKLSCVCLPLGKLVNEKHFPVKGKFGLVFNLDGKHFPEVMKNLEMSLFADYIKFDPQTFNCYIYFVLNIYFLISSLKI
jgi:hypothetical protein